MKGTTKRCYILNIQALGLVVSEKKIFSYFSNLGPRDMVGRIYEGGYQILIHIKYLSSGSHGFREKDFLGF